MPFSTPISRLSLPITTLLALFALPGAGAQRIQPQPVTDSAAQASPLTPVPKAPADDTSSQASPIPPERRGGIHFAPHTTIPITLGRAIDSGKLKQGDTVPARLAAPLAVSANRTLPAGTPVVLSVIETVPAGRISAVGEFSLQIVQVGKIAVYTNTLVFDGKPGHQDLPDSAPSIGTDAGLPSGAPLTFHVLPPPVDADQLPQRTGKSEDIGSVSGVAPGGPPPDTSLKSTYGDPRGAGSGNTPAQQQQSVSPGNTTTNQQTRQAQQPGVAPNQPQSPSQTSPTPGKPQ